MPFGFLLSRFGLSGKLSEKNIEKTKFIMSRLFPPDRPELFARRLRNLALSFVAWRYGTVLGEVKPNVLQIETVSGCNFNCVMCGAGNLPKEFMSYEDFKKMIEKIPEAFAVILNLGGEPFLSRDVMKMIRYASFEKRLIVNVFSNFSIMPDPDEVLSSGLYEIHASIDTFNPQKFSRIRKGGRLEKVVENVSKLIDAKRKNGAALPMISINAVSAEEFTEDAEDVIINAIKLGADRVKFQRLLFDVPELRIPSEHSRKHLVELKKKYRNKIEVVLNNFEDVGDRARGYCYLAYFMMAVKVDGDAYPCCMPYPFFSSYVMGNIFQSDEPLIRRNEFVKNFRKSPPEFCRKCSIYHRR